MIHFQSVITMVPGNDMTLRLLLLGCSATSGAEARDRTCGGEEVTSALGSVGGVTAPVGNTRRRCLDIFCLSTIHHN